MKTLCYSGHRPGKLGGYGETPQKLRICRVLTTVTRRFIEGDDPFDHFICGSALGVDQWAAQIIIDLKKEFQHVKLTLAIPYNGFGENWPQSSRDYLQKQIQAADEVVYVCDPPYAREKMQKRNEWMANRSDAAIVVWDGTTGGTNNFVIYAKSIGLHMFRINPITLYTSWIN
jgi:uncharacterized phage-like protein YoqJ